MPDLSEQRGGECQRTPSRGGERERTVFRAAIAATGVICAAGNGLPALRTAVQNNTSCLRHDPRFDSPRFQSAIVGAAPRDANSDNPAWELADTALRAARHNAREILAAIPPERIALILSTTKANIEALERITEKRPCSATARRHLRADLLAADLATAHGARGPIQTLSVACVSGLIAIQQAAKLIEAGTAHAVLVIGVDHLSAFVVSGFTALKALDPEGCRPFDRDRRGLTPGEAGAALVLVRSDLAPANSPQILGWGTSNDANHLTGPSRDGSGLARAIRAALTSAKLLPHDLDLIHAHGTGTPYNDAMESLALHTIFADTCPPVSASKGLHGHTLGTAGILETIICDLAFREKIIPGTPRLKVPAEGTPSTLVLAPRPAPNLRRILKLNTGFGGINGALILGAPA